MGHHLHSIYCKRLDPHVLFLSILGEVLPIGGVNSKIEAAANAGIKEVIIPFSNLGDVVHQNNVHIKIIPVKNIIDVIENAMVDNASKRKLVKSIKQSFKKRYAGE